MSEFSLGLAVDGVDLVDDETVNTLIDAGIEDASFAIRDGSNIVYLDREGDRFPEVVVRAVRELEGAHPSLKVVGLDAGGPLSQSGVAVFSGRSRQSVHQHVSGSRGSGFPPPVSWVDGTRPLWLRSDVRQWLLPSESNSGDATSNEDWEELLSGAFSFARTACSVKQKAFVPALEMAVERYIALSTPDREEVGQLSVALRVMADRIDKHKMPTPTRSKFADRSKVPSAGSFSPLSGSSQADAALRHDLADLAGDTRDDRGPIS